MAEAKKRSAEADIVGAAGAGTSGSGASGAESESAFIGLPALLIPHGAGCAADHPRKPHHSAENHAGDINPVRMEPAIREPPQHVAEEYGRRDDEADFGIARRGRDRARYRALDRLGPALGILGHILRHNAILRQQRREFRLAGRLRDPSGSLSPWRD